MYIFHVDALQNCKRQMALIISYPATFLYLVLGYNESCVAVQNARTIQLHHQKWNVVSSGANHLALPYILSHLVPWQATRLLLTNSP